MIPDKFFLDIIIVFEVTHLWHPQKMDDKWPSHFYYPQKLAIDLLFKIMESANTWQILRTPPSPHPFCLDMINVCFFSGFLKFGLSHVWMQMKFWLLLKFSQVTSVKLSKKPRNGEYIKANHNFCFRIFVFHNFYYIHTPFFINNLFLTLASNIVSAFLKNRPKKLLSNCFVDGILTSIV